MSANYTHPRVRLETIAKRRRSVVIEDPKKTCLFSPIIAEKGPVNELVKLHNLDELYSIYGNTNYDIQGQTILNITNFLADPLYNGYVYCVRLEGHEAAKASAEISITLGANIYNIIFNSKYEGSYYNGWTISTSTANNLVTFTLKDSYSRIVQQIRDVNASTLYSRLSTMADFDFVVEIGEAASAIAEATFAGGVGGLDDKTLPLFHTMIKDFFNGFVYEEAGLAANSTVTARAYDFIGDPLRTDAELILDAGYPLDTKHSILSFVSNIQDAENNELAIPVIFDNYDVETGDEVSFDNEYLSSLGPESPYLPSHPSIGNTAIYDGRLKVYDPSLYKDIKVTTTYHLASNIPYIDTLYGLGEAFVGPIRGVITVGTPIKVLNMEEKESLWKNHINYIEVTSRETCVMGERSQGELSTAYEQFYVARLLYRIKRNLLFIGRQHLMDRNSASMHSLVHQQCNDYLQKLLDNGTLESFSIYVEPSEENIKAFNIVLESIKFYELVELVNINITVE
jgi:hypothetical protein